MTKHDLLTAYFLSGDAIRSRSVGDVVVTGLLGMPAAPGWLQADWQRQASEDLALRVGDVEELSIARMRMRWPEYRVCVTALQCWAAELGLPGLTEVADVALMACYGTNYHHDAEHYGDVAFCNLFLSDDCNLDLHFPLAGLRIPLRRGTVVMFDTAQPHAVIRRGSITGFDAADFTLTPLELQVFLSWELPIEHPAVALALQIAFDREPVRCSTLQEAQVLINGARATLCPYSGQWEVVE